MNCEKCGKHMVPDTADGYWRRCVDAPLCDGPSRRRGFPFSEEGCPNADHPEEMGDCRLCGRPDKNRKWWER